MNQDIFIYFFDLINPYFRLFLCLDGGRSLSSSVYVECNLQLDNFLPKANGIANAGKFNFAARSDHVHPAQTWDIY